MLKGQINPDKPTLVRMHRLDLMIDLLGELHKNRNHGELQQAMQIIAENGAGVIVVLRESSLSSLSEILLIRQDPQAKTGAPELREI